jgi:hypothetical protein
MEAELIAYENGYEPEPKKWRKLFTIHPNVGRREPLVEITKSTNELEDRYDLVIRDLPTGKILVHEILEGRDSHDDLLFRWGLWSKHFGMS